MDKYNFQRNMNGFEEQKNDILKEQWNVEIHEIDDIHEYFALYSIFIFGISRKLTQAQRNEFQKSFDDGLIKLVKLVAESYAIREKKSKIN